MLYKATPESPRMFENDFIDGFSRIPAWVVPAIYVPAVTAFVAVGAWSGVGPLALAAQLAVGWLVWTLMEYWLHRTLFHWVPDTSWGESFHFYLHGVHHTWHLDKLRLVMPPAVSISLGIAFFSVAWGVAQALAPWLDPTWVWAYFAGKMLGYMVYDLAHYYVHHFTPRTRVGKLLRKHHMAHHHNARFHDRKYGVSTTLWDHVFGTYAA
ncbi:MAG: sterol desaturase family protein [Alphaproteobacteria bacterium]|nr:sterol desaturase family protein [Alphaproteobacteria bacterium]